MRFVRQTTLSLEECADYRADPEVPSQTDPTHIEKAPTLRGGKRPTPPYQKIDENGDDGGGSMPNEASVWQLILTQQT